MVDSQAAAPSRGTFPRWYEWLAGGLILLFAFGYFVVRPAAERLLQGIGGLAAVIATQAAETLTQTYAQACQAVEQDPAVQGLLGGQITCAPIENVSWQQPSDSETLAFEFEVQSDSGKQGTVVVVAKLHSDGPVFESIVVRGDEQSVLLLPVQ
jgi:hypothetical protein